MLDLLDRIAEEAYNQDAQWVFKTLTDYELEQLAGLCQITDTNPGGRCYDDEVFDEIDERASLQRQ